MGTLVLTQNPDGTTCVLTGHQYETARAASFTPDWENSDTRPALEHGISKSRARDMGLLKNRMADLTDQQLWAAMNTTARKTAVTWLDDQVRQREWAVICQAQDERLANAAAGIAKVVKEQGPLFRAMLRVVRKHAVGVKSETIHVHSLYVKRMLDDAGVTNYQHVDDGNILPDLIVGDTRISSSWVEHTPETATVDSAEMYARWQASSPTPMTASLEAFVAKRVADMIERGSVREVDVVVFSRSGTKHPNIDLGYIAPVTFTDAEAEVYEGLRAAGMSPAHAEQAAKLV